MMPQPPDNHVHVDQLENALHSLRRVVIAFSGGVDSSVVAAAAHAANLESAVAVTADSPSVPAWQIKTAKSIAAEIGIEHQIVRTHEVARPEYQQNDRQRCFYCKETLYDSLQQVAASFPNATIVSGTNADDLGDHRPGIDAGANVGVVTPLADLGFSKVDVRHLAGHYQLSNQSLPASPCLASRIAYGTEVTPGRLGQIEQAEDYLRKQGFDLCRVRLHPDDLARIEVPKDQIGDLIKLSQDGSLTSFFDGLGFKFVSVDLAGFRSGSMNRVLVSIDQPSSDPNKRDRNKMDRNKMDRNPGALD
jgi:uncharacterized protein